MEPDLLEQIMEPYPVSYLNLDKQLQQEQEKLDLDVSQKEPSFKAEEEEVSIVKEDGKVKDSMKRRVRKVDEKKTKLRTSKDVYDRLKWDSCVQVKGWEEPLALSSVYIGYRDRFLGICEIPFESFMPSQEEGDIPYHRIYYFRTGGPPLDPFVGRDGEIRVREHNIPPNAVFLWDREARTDLIFHSGYSS